MRCHSPFLPGSCTEEGERVPEGLPWAGEAFPGSSGVIRSGGPARGCLEDRGRGQQPQAPAGTASGQEVLKKAVCLTEQQGGGPQAAVWVPAEGGNGPRNAGGRDVWGASPGAPGAGSARRGPVFFIPVTASPSVRHVAGPARRDPKIDKAEGIPPWGSLGPARPFPCRGGLWARVFCAPLSAAHRG